MKGNFEITAVKNIYIKHIHIFSKKFVYKSKNYLTIIFFEN